MSIQLHHGDCLDVLPTLPAASVQCVVTSPPYYGLRSYLPDGHADKASELGLEQSPQEYVDRLVAVFREVWRVLRPDGTCWLNLGDSFAANRTYQVSQSKHQAHDYGRSNAAQRVPDGLKPKDLMMIPARVALALQADGWWLRSEIIWSKSAPMPESVRDRPTCAHEKVFLLTKAERYFYDADAVREPFADERLGASGAKSLPYSAGSGRTDTLADGEKRGLGISPEANGRNLRNVWHLNPEPSPIAHYAMMPTKLALTCIKAGSRLGDTVLDPFAGTGTTLLVADRLQRHGIGIELNGECLAIARRRFEGDAGLFTDLHVA